MNLFRVIFSISTAPARPALWGEREGYCHLCLFADDVDDATQRAKVIIETLPFVVTDTQARVAALDGPRRPEISILGDDDSLKETRREMEENARRTGLAFAWVPIGYAQPAQLADTRMIKFVIDPNMDRGGAAD